LRNDYNLNQYLRRCDGVSDAASRIAYRKLALEALQRVSQLAVIDGALILNSNFDVVTFGAKLSAAPWPGKIVVGSDGFGHTNRVAGESDADARLLRRIRIWTDENKISRRWREREIAYSRFIRNARPAVGCIAA